MKVLILLASFGDGHRQAANALIEAFHRYPDVETVAVDPFRGTNRLLAGVNEYIYEWSTKYLPILYGLSYDLTNRVSLSHPLWRLLAAFSRKATWQTVRDYRPDIIIQLFPDHALATMPPELEAKPLTVAVLTDLSVHVRWFHKNIEHYYLPCSMSAMDAQKHLNNANVMTVSGIPIRQQFSGFQFRDSRDPQHIMISAGGRGVFPDLPFVIKALARRFKCLDIVVMCGRNESMRRDVDQLREALGYPTHRVRALGFVDDVADLLAKSAFVVAKAGGISISESLACHAPLLFYRPLAGQERRNAEMIAQMGAGRVATTKKNLCLVLDEFDGDSLEAMHKACQTYAHPDAARTVAESVLSLLRSSEV